jgi:hypothetical protein
MPVFLHALAAFVLGNFCFSSFFQGTHISIFQRWSTFPPDQPPVVNCYLVNDFIQRILDNPFGAQVFEIGDNLADDFLVDDGFDCNPA